jgi:hypothetical protein
VRVEPRQAISANPPHSAMQDQRDHYEHGAEAAVAAAPGPPRSQHEDNHLVAQRLREMAELLDAEGANPYRAIAYRAAADMLARLPRSVREIFDREGVAGLDALPSIGPSIAASIAEMLASGHWSQLERHRRSADPPSLLRTVPGVGLNWRADCTKRWACTRSKRWRRQRTTAGSSACRGSANGARPRSPRR